MLPQDRKLSGIQVWTLTRMTACQYGHPPGWTPHQNGLPAWKDTPRGWTPHLARHPAWIDTPSGRTPCLDALPGRTAAWKFGPPGQVPRGRLGQGVGQGGHPGGRCGGCTAYPVGGNAPLERQHGLHAPLQVLQGLLPPLLLLLSNPGGGRFSRAVWACDMQ